MQTEQAGRMRMGRRNSFQILFDVKQVDASARNKFWAECNFEANAVNRNLLGVIINYWNSLILSDGENKYEKSAPLWRFIAEKPSDMDVIKKRVYAITEVEKFMIAIKNVGSALRESNIRWTRKICLAITPN